MLPQWQSSLMLEPLYTAAEMRAAEERYPGYPETAPELMERAGAAVAREVLQLFPNAHRVAVVCGGGANGGDGRIAARILRDEGLDAVETTAVEQADVIVDALFGTGFHGEPRAEAAATIQRINAAAAPVVSVDVPSGVDASTGEVAGEAVRARPRWLPRPRVESIHIGKMAVLWVPTRAPAGSTGCAASLRCRSSRSTSGSTGLTG